MAETEQPPARNGALAAPPWRTSPISPSPSSTGEQYRRCLPRFRQILPIPSLACSVRSLLWNLDWVCVKRKNVWA
ncbi:hypothetical protein ZWY2020_001627 [Hordeum vulgare]|nr:hypothetical protein ZWY2020_001627 [Hordeum vulgare]